MDDRSYVDRQAFRFRLRQGFNSAWSLAPVEVSSRMLSIALGLYFGLSAYLPLDPDCRAPQALPPDVEQSLRSDPGIPFDVELTDGLDPDGGAVVRGSIAYRTAGSAVTRRLRFEYYHAQSEAARCPVILVNPISGGRYELERAIARDLARHGNHAIVLFRVPRGEAGWLGGDFQALEDELRSSVASRRRLVDWLETRSEIDTARIGVHGTSLGGILSVLHAAADQRIVATVIFMAGGDLSELLWRSIERGPRRFARAHGLTRDASDEDLVAFREVARATVKTDPCQLAKYIDPQSIFMAIARRDT
ncbi:MAG: dienelactone hydrolase family protein, partial [Verrucomicrobiales bacterium]